MKIDLIAIVIIDATIASLAGHRVVASVDGGSRLVDLHHRDEERHAAKAPGQGLFQRL
jgi:hypothetical protein